MSHALLPKRHRPTLLSGHEKAGREWGQVSVFASTAACCSRVHSETAALAHWLRHSGEDDLPGKLGRVSGTWTKVSGACAGRIMGCPPPSSGGRCGGGF